MKSREDGSTTLKEPINGAHPKRPLAWTALAALGVVYGDIGTSPLYAIRECFHGTHAFAASQENILGILSLIFWSLILVISVKYLLYVMEADNRGEGGVLALMALARRKRGGAAAWEKHLILGLGLFGSALLYGDAIITPGISVLSAMEGLEVAAPSLQEFVIPATIAILIGLFLIQRFGSGRVGSIFGPTILLWFVVLALLGAPPLVRNPDILSALNPVHAVWFFVRNGWSSVLVLGAVFLVVTGGEALYADMGHFGRFPIRVAWFAVVLPGLLINYFGQGALLLENPTAVSNPFYQLTPRWALYPVIGLATVSTIIASQAVISGAFSLTRQAVLLGFLPRVQTVHTSATEIGQIYIPIVNQALTIGTIALVATFKSSANLAAAYGIAVSTTMVITTILANIAARHVLKMNAVLIAFLTILFAAIDISFFGANLLKIEYGGWLPIGIGFALFVLMITWRRGREILASRMEAKSYNLEEFWQKIEATSPSRVSGTAVFLTLNQKNAPPALLINTDHNHVVHEQVALVTVITEDVPIVAEEERIHVETLEHGFFRVLIHYGFLDRPDVPLALKQTEKFGLRLEPQRTTFFLGKETLLATPAPGMARWREKLFAFLSLNSQKSAVFFGIPTAQVVEIGSQVEL